MNLKLQIHGSKQNQKESKKKESQNKTASMYFKHLSKVIKTLTTDINKIWSIEMQRHISSIL